MSISTYSELQTTIAGWINRDDLGTVIPDFIRLAEARIATDLKTQHLITETTITTDAASKALPSNFKGAVSAYLNTDPKTTLDYMTPDEITSRVGSNTTGKPLAFTIKGNVIYFMPSPDDSYDCILSHYTTPDLATDTTNSLLTNYPDLYLFAAMVEALDYIEQDSSKYEMKYQRARQAADDEADYLGALSIHLGYAP